jgi:hypothetical protein
MVGAEGFEPPTFCSQSRRATRLRYAPTEHIKRVNNTQTSLFRQMFLMTNYNLYILRLRNVIRLPGTNIDEMERLQQFWHEESFR